jgi:hypothetical protein
MYFLSAINIKKYLTLGQEKKVAYLGGLNF